MKLVRDLAIFEDRARKQHDPMLYGYQKHLVRGHLFLHPSVSPKCVVGKCSPVCRVKGPKCSPYGGHTQER